MKINLYLVLSIFLMVVIVFQYFLGSVGRHFEREFFGRLLRSLQHQVDQGNTRDAMIILESISHPPSRNELVEANEKFAELKKRQQAAQEDWNRKRTP